MSVQASQKRILIVDDDLQLLDVCSRALANVGYIVFAASSAEEAHSYIDENKLDLLILDIYLPNQDGISLLKDVYDVDPSLSAIVITGYPAVNTVIDAIRLNVKEYLCKPFTLPKLLSAVESSLQDSDEAKKSES